MEVEFRKDLRHSYMVITKDESLGAAEYCTGILGHQTIEGVLPLELRCFDNQVFYYYEITSKQNLIPVLERTALTSETLRILFQGLLNVMEEVYEYLLSEDDFILSPEFIYLDIVRYQPYLCYLPGSARSIKKQMSTLIEYLMNKIDYADKDAVLLICQLYAISREEEFNFNQLAEVLQRDLQQEIKEQTARKKASRITEGFVAPEIIDKESINYKSLGKEKQEPIRKLSDSSVVTEEADRLKHYPVMKERIESETEILCYPMQSLILSGICVVIGILITVLGFTSGILYNSFGNRIDYSKLLALLLIILSAESYILKKLLDSKNKIAKVIKTCEYIDPRKNFELQGIRLGRKPKAHISDDLGVVQEKEQTGGKLQIAAEGSPERNDLKPEGLHYTEIEAKSEIRKLIKYQEEMPEEADYNPTCLLSSLPAKNPYLTLKAIDNTKEKDILVTEFPFFLGKLNKNMNYRFDKEVISRYHAKITREDDQYFIFDLNSMNGSYVNGEALQPYQKKEIKTGDEIAFANIKYHLV